MQSPIKQDDDVKKCVALIEGYTELIEIKQNVYDGIKTNGQNLSEIIAKSLQVTQKTDDINANKWLNSRYLPTPTIIEVAEVMYNSHSVDDITKNEAADNLSKTSQAVQKIIEYSRKIIKNLFVL